MVAGLVIAPFVRKLRKVNDFRHHEKKPIYLES